MVIGQFLPDNIDGAMSERIYALLGTAFPDVNGHPHGPDEPGRIVLALLGAEVVGHLALHLRAALLDGVPETVGMIGGVAVAGRFQRRGVARALVA